MNQHKAVVSDNGMDIYVYEGGKEWTLTPDCEARWLAVRRDVDGTLYAGVGPTVWEAILDAKTWRSIFEVAVVADQGTAGA